MIANNHDRALLNSPKSIAFFALPEPLNFIIKITLNPTKIRGAFSRYNLNSRASVYG